MTGKIFKRIISLVCAIAAASSLAACSQSTDESSAEQQTTSSVAESVAEEKYVLGEEITGYMKDASRLNEGNKVRLANVIKKLGKGEAVTIGYIGGSITNGSAAGSELCYAKLTSEWLKEQFPSAGINYVNASIGATGSHIGVHRVQKDLLCHEPDLVFVEFAVNDTTGNTERDKTAFDSLMRTIWTNQSSPAVITVITTQQDGTSFQKYHNEVALAYDLPVISYRDSILEAIRRKDIKWEDISDDDIHPNEAGHKIMAQLIESYLSDVIADADSISGEESDFSSPATSADFENGVTLTPSDIEPIENNGFTASADTTYLNFTGMWSTKVSDGNFGGASLTFEVTGKSIGLLYTKFVKSGGYADIYIDDAFAATINSDFSGGWGNYVESAHLKTFSESGTHTVKIVPKDSDSSSAVFIMGLLVA